MRTNRLMAAWCLGAMCSAAGAQAVYTSGEQYVTVDMSITPFLDPTDGVDETLEDLTPTSWSAVLDRTVGGDGEFAEMTAVSTLTSTFEPALFDASGSLSLMSNFDASGSEYYAEANSSGSLFAEFALSAPTFGRVVATRSIMNDGYNNMDAYPAFFGPGGLQVGWLDDGSLPDGPEYAGRLNPGDYDVLAYCFVVATDEDFEDPMHATCEWSITVELGCNLADMNIDGVLNIDDIDAMVAAKLDGTLDLDGNGVCNIDDIDDYVGHFLNGCP